ncbi:MAG: hypothetical protein JO337_04775 [Acidimicrobiales bacterium]|nr:hypothetical protein [Acidimicrobiales bacterium]
MDHPLLHHLVEYHPSPADVSGAWALGVEIVEAPCLLLVTKVHDDGRVNGYFLVGEELVRVTGSGEGDGPGQYQRRRYRVQPLTAA